MAEGADPMTESPTLNKLTVLRRAEIGGLLSALATGIPMFIGHFLELQSTSFLSIFLQSFALPGAIISFPFHNPYRLPDILSHMLLSLPYWFLFGFGLSLFIEDNSRAISVWLWLVLISSIVITLLVHSLVGAFQ
jgi:hypothetical protein